MEWQKNKVEGKGGKVGGKKLEGRQRKRYCIGGIFDQGDSVPPFLNGVKISGEVHEPAVVG